MVEKFQCQHCGECCKNYKDQENGGITLFEWEKNKLDQLSKELGIELEVEPLAIHKVGKNYIADSFLIKTSPCPFLNESGCLIYNNRPLTCKIFPIDTFMYIPSEHAFKLVFVPRCFAFDKNMSEKFMGRHEDKEFQKALKEYFGKEVLLLSIQRGETLDKLIDIVDEIGGEQVRFYNELSDEERKNLTIYPLFTFCKKYNLLSKQRIRTIIDEHNSLKDVEDYSDLLNSLD